MPLLFGWLGIGSLFSLVVQPLVDVLLTSGYLGSLTNRIGNNVLHCIISNYLLIP